ncbi:signal peptidase II [Desulfosediminicola flagellatus]|uniref:signal peptidase II n=1 Tax=Desulfosediminicola flagellatus TaxID=2569541 RepID=UPI0010AC975F|nr:signal peptidase II [Desulfosediminicola flagellatus]
MQRQSRLIHVILIVLAGLFGDQLTKMIARHYLEGRVTTHFLFNTIQFQYVENHGGFLGYFNILPEPFRFYVLTFGVGSLLFMSLYLLITTAKFSDSQCIFLSFIIAGGLGNLLDRLINNGGVIDFISIGIGPLRSGIFNFADALILACSFGLGMSLTRD